MRVLQLLHRYLDESSNWIYQQLKYMRKSQLMISAPIFINPKYLHLEADWIKPYLKILPQTPDSSTHRVLQKINEWLWKKKLSASIQNVDLIHIHFGGFASKQLEWLVSSGKPFVISLYGYDYLQLPTTNKMIGRKYPDMFEKASGILVEGPHGKKILTDTWKVPENKVHIAPLGINLPDNKKLRDWKKPQHFKWLQVANFKEKKGHAIAIKAFAKMLENRPGDTLTFVGEGPEKEKCIQLTQDLGLHDAIHFENALSHNELENFMTGFDVFIHPSFQTKDGDTEGGAPVILLEAQSLGIPVISTFHADIPNILVDGITGLLAEEGSMEDLKNKMENFTSLTEEVILEMKKNAVNHIYSKFNATSCAQVIESIYEQILQNK